VVSVLKTGLEFMSSPRNKAIAAPQPPLRFLFASLGHIESEFYGRVGDELAARGHEVAHVVYSRWSARALAAKGYRSFCLPDRMASLGHGEVEKQSAVISKAYGVTGWREIYRTDFVCDGRPERWCVERTVRHMLAMEEIFAEWSPTVVVPEVGNETIRTAAHLVGLRRGTPVLFLFYTLFPNPLRLCVDEMHGPIVPVDSLRGLTRSQRDEVDQFSAEFLERDTPIRPYRSTRLTAHRVRMLGRHLAVRVLADRDNPYLQPLGWVARDVRNSVRGRAARGLYVDPRAERPFVYFPLHVGDDYKLKRLLPHCADQVALIKLVAEAVPAGFDVVVKEHPLSIGRNKLGMLAALRKIPNVRLVAPRTSSLRLIAGANAVTVISSTVGLEALLAGRPVLTLGRPFYAGYGVTIDVTDFGEIDRAVGRVLEFEPDRDRIAELLYASMQVCQPGAPVLVDDSDENAVRLAASLERVGGQAQPPTDPSNGRVPDGQELDLVLRPNLR
jgi:hypothetical protein